MPLLLYDFTDVIAFGASHSTLDRAFQKAGAEMGVKLSPDPMPEQAVFVRSDHYAMVRRGVPAVMLATGMANGGDAAWPTFLSTHYHHPSDECLSRSSGCRARSSPSSTTASSGHWPMTMWRPSGMQRTTSGTCSRRRRRKRRSQPGIGLSLDR